MLKELRSIEQTTKNISVEASCTILDKQPLFIIIIGESATKHHLGLYGYTRETSAFTKEISPLHIFHDVVSASSATITALKAACTIQTSSSQTASLVDFFNSAGFKTELYSNQPTGGRYDSALSYIFNNAQKKYYSIKYGQYVKEDGILLDKIISSIQEQTGPKVIFIHLFGSHADYIDRYPKSFSKFSGSDCIDNKSFIPTSKKIYAQTRINTYDNSILYTDHIISRIIEAAKNTSRYSYAIYFSDHGEENYDFRDYSGRGGNNSNIIYDIPFIIWTSEDFLQDHKNFFTDDIKNRQLYMKNFIPSVLQLSNISTDSINFANSFFAHHPLQQQRYCDDREYSTLIRQ
ncbi:MAG: phosphoethanolamine transferase [Desulfovibrionaceae bacterium]|nr:phosphoethanolamine transferase [Desulfovibrionaceae bacterium]